MKEPKLKIKLREAKITREDKAEWMWSKKSHLEEAALLTTQEEKKWSNETKKQTQQKNGLNLKRQSLDDLLKFHSMD